MLEIATAPLLILVKFLPEIALHERVGQAIGLVRVSVAVPARATSVGEDARGVFICDDGVIDANIVQFGADTYDEEGVIQTHGQRPPQHAPPGVKDAEGPFYGDTRR